MRVQYINYLSLFAWIRDRIMMISVRSLLRLQFFRGDLHAAENIHEITQWVNKKSLIPGINHESQNCNRLESVMILQ